MFLRSPRVNLIIRKGQSKILMITNNHKVPFALVLDEARMEKLLLLVLIEIASYLVEFLFTFRVMLTLS